MSREFRTIGLTLGVALFVVGLQLVLTAGSANAATATLTSDDFTFGYGATLHTAPIWSTTENAGNNSLTAQGNFTFSPSPASVGEWSPNGVGFANRTLTFNKGVTAYPGDEGFSVPIVASYSGPAPANADPTNPNYQLKLEITGLGMYLGSYPASVGGTDGGVAKWVETTAGHSQTSPLTTISMTAGEDTPSHYTHMLWDPDDYSVGLASLGSSVTRSFTIPVEGGVALTDYRFMDGLEVFGRVSLTYNAVVPEPSTFVLAFVASVSLLAYAWRKRR